MTGPTPLAAALADLLAADIAASPVMASGLGLAEDDGRLSSTTSTPRSSAPRGSSWTGRCTWAR